MGSPKALHNMVSRWLNERGGDGVGVAHDGDKPYSVRGVRRLGSGVSAVEIALLDDALAEVLTGRAAAGSAVECGFWAGSVLGVSAVECVGWPELCTPAGDYRWLVQFGPTTFRSGGNYSPWPDPVTVITGVHRRLRSVYSAGFGELARLQSSTVWVSRVAGRTEMVQVKAGARPAFVGEVTYEADPGWAGLGEVEKVFRCAALAGVGSHTAYGLGAVQVQSSRPTRHSGRPARSVRR